MHDVRPCVTMQANGSVGSVPEAHVWVVIWHLSQLPSIQSSMHPQLCDDMVQCVSAHKQCTCTWANALGLGWIGETLKEIYALFKSPQLD